MKERALRFSSFWVFPLLSIALLTLSYRGQPHRFIADFAESLFIGLAFWTLLEYLFHRFLLHAEFHNTALRALVNVSHARHHAAPRDRDQILVKAPFALVTSALIYALLFAITRDWFETSAIMSGIWLGFLYYEAVHYRVHISLAHSNLLQRQRRAHFHHHFSDSQKCFGVTTPMWDYVFGTMRR